MSSHRVAFIDFDSTLLKGETFELLAQEFKPDLLQETRSTNQKSVEGKMPFFDCIIERAKHFKGLHISDFRRVFQRMEYTAGAKDLISYLKSKNIKVVCLSGGFESVIHHAQKSLGFDHYWANQFQTDQDGYLTGQVSGSMMNENSKGVMVKRLQELFGFKPTQTIVIGDGANDASMFNFNYADYRVAFCAVPILKEKANIIIDQPDLRLVIPHLESLG